MWNILNTLEVIIKSETQNFGGTRELVPLNLKGLQSGLENHAWGSYSNVRISIEQQSTFIQ